VQLGDKFVMRLSVQKQKKLVC